MAVIVRILRIVPLLLVLPILQGCPKSLAITVYNNTASELFVELENDKTKWAPGTSLRFDANIDRLEWVHEDELFIPVLKVREGARVVSYKLLSARRPVPMEYIGHSPAKAFTSGTEEYLFQMEQDGNLYIVKPGAPSPERTLDRQPPGFPIIPTPTDPSG